METSEVVVVAAIGVADAAADAARLAAADRGFVTAAHTTGAGTAGATARRRVSPPA